MIRAIYPGGSNEISEQSEYFPIVKLLGSSFTSKILGDFTIELKSSFNSESLELVGKSVKYASPKYNIQNHENYSMLELCHSATPTRLSIYLISKNEQTMYEYRLYKITISKHSLLNTSAQNNDAAVKKLEEGLSAINLQLSNFAWEAKKQQSLIQSLESRNSQLNNKLSKCEDGKNTLLNQNSRLFQKVKNLEAQMLELKNYTYNYSYNNNYYDESATTKVYSSTVKKTQPAKIKKVVHKQTHNEKAKRKTQMRCQVGPQTKKKNIQPKEVKYEQHENYEYQYDDY